jgi:hypothetical protein
MIVHRKLSFLAAIVGLIVTSCAPAISAAPAVTSIPPTVIPANTAAPQTGGVPDQPITLHLAVSDTQGRASEPYVLEFVDQVNTLSKGNITVVPVWGSARI